MGNPQRGEYDFDAQGKAWTLRYSYNTLAAIEDYFDAPMQEVGLWFANTDKPPRISKVIAFVRFGLRDSHPDLTDEQVGELITDVGPNAMMEHVSEAFALTFPESVKGGSARPQKAARRGTGKNS